MSSGLLDRVRQIDVVVSERRFRSLLVAAAMQEIRGAQQPLEVLFPAKRKMSPGVLHAIISGPPRRICVIGLTPKESAAKVLNTFPHEVKGVCDACDRAPWEQLLDERFNLLAIQPRNLSDDCSCPGAVMLRALGPQLSRRAHDLCELAVTANERKGDHPKIPPVVFEGLPEDHDGGAMVYSHVVNWFAFDPRAIQIGQQMVVGG